MFGRINLGRDNALSTLRFVTSKISLLFSLMPAFIDVAVFLKDKKLVILLFYDRLCLCLRRRQCFDSSSSLFIVYPVHCCWLPVIEYESCSLVTWLSYRNLLCIA